MKEFFKILFLDTLFTVVDVALIAAFVKMLLVSSVGWAIFFGIAILCSVMVQFIVALLVARNDIRSCVSNYFSRYKYDEDDYEYERESPRF